MSGPVALSAVACVFVVSGVAKLADPSALAHVSALLRVPEHMRTPAVRAFSVAELALAAWLLAGGGATAAAVSLVVLAAFTGVLIHLTRVAPSTSCGCLGGMSSGGHGVAVVRNACLAALLVPSVFESGAPSALEVLVGAQLALLLLLATEGGGVLIRMRAMTGGTSA